MTHLNYFRLTGDFLHLLAINILFIKIWNTKSSEFISGKTQILFALVYTARYVDLINYFRFTPYNITLKIFYLAATYATLLLVYWLFRKTNSRKHDTFSIEFLVLPCLCLAMVYTHAFEFMEVLWTFSIYLESVAILPQLFLLAKLDQVNKIMHYYVICFGLYRGFYLLNWIYRYQEEHYFDIIAILGGVVHVTFFIDFYWKRVTYMFLANKCGYGHEPLPIHIIQVDDTNQLQKNIIFSEKEVLNNLSGEKSEDVEKSNVNLARY